MKIQAAGAFTPPAADVEEPAPYTPPYDPTHDFGLPSSDAIAKGLKAQREREVGNAEHSALDALSESGDVVASPFAFLDTPPLARAFASAPEDAGIIVIGGFDAGGAHGLA